MNHIWHNYAGKIDCRNVRLKRIRVCSSVPTKKADATASAANAFATRESPGNQLSHAVFRGSGSTESSDRPLSVQSSRRTGRFFANFLKYKSHQRRNIKFRCPYIWCLSVTNDTHSSVLYLLSSICHSLAAVAENRSIGRTSAPVMDRSSQQTHKLISS